MLHLFGVYDYNGNIGWNTVRSIPQELLKNISLYGNNSELGAKNVNIKINWTDIFSIIERICKLSQLNQRKWLSSVYEMLSNLRRIDRERVKVEIYEKDS